MFVLWKVDRTVVGGESRLVVDQCCCGAVIKISDFLIILVYVDDKLCCPSKTHTHFYLCRCLFLVISNGCSTNINLNKSTLCRVISYDKLNISLYYLRTLFKFV